jgi:hypothetical protein
MSIVEYFKLLGHKKPNIYRTIKRFEKQENVERKIDPGRKCAILSSKAIATFKKQTVGRSSKSYRELGQKIQVFEKKY